MFEIKFEDPGSSGNVISLKAKRESMHARRIARSCKHHRVEFDTSHTTLNCLDCKRKLNPIEYLAMLVEEWAYVHRLYEQYKTAKVAFEAKQRCRCEHCGKITKVRPASAAEIRAFKREPG